MTEIGLFSKDMKELLQEKVFVTVVLGQIALWMSSVFHSFCTSAIDSGVPFAYIVQVISPTTLSLVLIPTGAPRQANRSTIW